jgi:arylsulfatase
LKKQDQGVLVACGGFTGGYSLFIKDNKVFYDYNYYHGVHYQLKSQELGEGEVHILFKFVEDGGSTKGIPGGFGELFINGKKVDEVKMPEMHISTFSLSETFDVGIDAGTAVTTEYPVDTHFPYTGKLDRITVRLTD